MYYAPYSYMIIIECDVSDYKNSQAIHYNQIVPCPNCKTGLGMWHYGYRLRKVRDFQGNTYWLKLPKYRCPKCKKVFHTLPSFLLPYKHYDRSTISNVRNGITNGCGASYLSIYLWSRYQQAL